MVIKGGKRVSNCKFRMKFTVADPFAKRVPPDENAPTTVVIVYTTKRVCPLAHHLFIFLLPYFTDHF